MGKFRGLDFDIGWIKREFKDIRRELRELRAAKGLAASTIGEGGLTVKGGGGITITDGGTFQLRGPSGQTMFLVLSNANNPDPSGNPQPSVFLYRSDGTLAMSLDDPLPGVDGYRQILRFFDRLGNEILSEDATSGEGLARPWLASTLTPTRYTDWLGTTSGTFETIWDGFVVKTHPKMLLDVQHTSDLADTTGEMRIRAAGNQVGATTSVGFVISAASIEEALPGAVGQAPYIEVQARRTAGTGQVRCRPRFVGAVQS